jgi:flagellar hook assembly protein FlgD
VHDAAGRLVRTLLADEPRDRGRHRVRWDGRDQGGRAVAAGIYLARLQSGETVQVQRLVLVR